MDATFINSLPETLKDIQNNNFIEGINATDLTHSIVLNEISDFTKIFKMLALLLIIFIFNIIFPYQDNKDDFNYKLYIILLVILLVYIIYANQLYIIIIVFIIISLFIIPLLLLLYFYIEKHEGINIIFYAYNNQLKNIFSNNFNIYELLFNIFFISIIFILSIVLYWDYIYADAKKLSKCGQILQIIEENNSKKNPYIYNIIIIDNDSIDINISKYIVKIVYNFMKMKTYIEHNSNKQNIYYSTDEIIDMKTNLYKNFINYDINETFLKSNSKILLSFTDTYNAEFFKELIKDNYIDKFIITHIDDNNINNHIDTKIDVYKSYTSEKKSEAKEYIKNLSYEEDVSKYYKKFDIDSNKENLKVILNKIFKENIKYKYDKLKTNLIDVDNYNNNYDKLKVKYFNLRNMDTDFIENIDPKIFKTPEKYKFLCVDEKNNPIYSYSSKELIKFIKNYANEEYNKYNPSIIYDIIYAKLNNNKVFT